MMKLFRLIVCLIEWWLLAGVISPVSAEPLSAASAETEIRTTTETWTCRQVFSVVGGRDDFLGGPFSCRKFGPNTRKNFGDR
jgi:hypothetical protein